jgi:hypothetical protein
LDEGRGCEEVAKTGSQRVFLQDSASTWTYRIAASPKLLLNV